MNNRRISALLIAMLMAITLMTPAVFAAEEIVPGQEAVQKEEAVQEPPAGQEPRAEQKPSAGQEPSAEQEPPAEHVSDQGTAASQEAEIYSVRVSIEINGYFSTEDFRIEDADGEVTVEDAIDFAIKEKELTELEEGWQYKVNGRECSDAPDEKVLRDDDAVYLYYETEPAPVCNSLASPQFDKPALDNAYGNTSDMLTESAEESDWSVGCEWVLMANARAGKVTEQAKEKYCSSLIATLKKKGCDKNYAILNANQSSENSKAIITLTAMGIDPRNVGGYNLLAPLGNMTYVGKQGMNGYVWALTAYNCVDSLTGTESNAAQKEALIAALLGERRPDNGWAYGVFSAGSDVDMTGMALQALSAFYKKPGRDNVTAAIDDALVWLKSQQAADGSFGSVAMSGRIATSESASQVITALTSLGIDPTGSDWTKNGNSVLDSLLSFYVKGGGFKHIQEHDRANGLASVQGHYALVAFYRFLDGKAGLYDMSDVGDGYVIDVDYTKEERDNIIPDDEYDDESDGEKNDQAEASGTTAAIGATKGLSLLKLSEDASMMEDETEGDKAAPTGYTRKLSEDDSAADWLPWAVGGAAAVIAAAGLIAFRRRNAA